MGFWQTILNFLIPPRCISCGKILSEQNGLCAECFNKIKFISEPLCQRCGRPLTNSSGLTAGKKYLCATCLREKKPLFTIQRSAYIYDDFSKKIILDFKFRDKTMSAQTLANLLYSAGRDIWKENPDILLAVPMHRIRLMKRRYNQAALLTNKLAEITHIPVDRTALIRTRNTIPQVELSGVARRKNLSSAFAVKLPQNIKGKSVVLIDDVSTTGSTLRECAKVLQKAGASAIYSVTLARTK
jgi:ComF family protein